MKSLFVFKRHLRTDSTIIIIIQGGIFRLKFIPCADLICLIYVRQEIWAAWHFPLAVINNALGSDFMFCLATEYVSDILQVAGSRTLFTVPFHIFDNKSVNVLNISHLSSKNGPEII